MVGHGATIMVSDFLTKDGGYMGESVKADIRNPLCYLISLIFIAYENS